MQKIPCLIAKQYKLYKVTTPKIDQLCELTPIFEGKLNKEGSQKSEH